MKNLYSIAAADYDAFVAGLIGSLITHTPARPAPFDHTQTYPAVSQYQTPYGVVVIEHWGDVAGPWFGRHRVHGLNRRMVNRIIADPLVRRENDLVIDITPLPLDLVLMELTNITCELEEGGK